MIAGGAFVLLDSDAVLNACMDYFESCGSPDTIGRK